MRAPASRTQTLGLGRNEANEAGQDFNGITEGFRSRDPLLLKLEREQPPPLWESWVGWVGREVLEAPVMRSRCRMVVFLVLFAVLFFVSGVQTSPLSPRLDSMKAALDALKNADLLVPSVSPSSPPPSIEISSLSAGFCNWVYKVSVPAALLRRRRRPSIYVVKIFSPLSQLRLPTSSLMPNVERIVTARRIGPPSLHCDKDSLVSVYLRGRTLTEKDFHSATFNRKLCDSVSKKVADLHSSIDLFRDMQQRRALLLTDKKVAVAGTAAGKDDVNMLWFTLEAMLSRLPPDPSDGGALVSQQWTLKRLREEVSFMKAFVDKEIGSQEKCVLGHGDLKPSNVMSVEDTTTGALKPRVPAMLIDFELSGPNYRGFDICKLFRTGSPTASTEPNMKAFAAKYLQQIDTRARQEGWRPGKVRDCRDGLASSSSSSSSSSTTPDLLVLEAKMFEGLTWLEAGVFFLFAGVEDPAKKESWAKLADDRLKKYEQCKARLGDIVDKYRAMKKLEDDRWKRISDVTIKRERS